jgi:hypothetical protein
MKSRRIAVAIHRRAICSRCNSASLSTRDVDPYGHALFWRIGCVGRLRSFGPSPSAPCGAASPRGNPSALPQTCEWASRSDPSAARHINSLAHRSASGPDAD